MTVTTLCIGDPHIQVTNIPEVDLFIERLINLATEKKPDLIIILGDVLHTHERLHSIALNKAHEMINNMRLITKTYILVGNHDMCLGKDTPILMWNGETKMSQNIKKGDILTGDDCKHRKVTSICKGISKCYLIEQMNGMDYVVNENHTLSLKCGFHKSLIYNNAKGNWTVKWVERESLILRSRFFTYKKDAQEFLNSIEDIDVIDISIGEYLKIPKNVREILYGFRTPPKDIDNRGIKYLDKNTTSIKISEIGLQEYYGFSVDGNHRFLLGDTTVTHNCNNQQFLTENHWMTCLKEMQNVVIVDKTKSETIQGEKFIFLPYVPPGRFEEALNTLKDGWKDASCIFAHQEFAGCKMGAIVSVEGDKWPNDYPHIVSGHIHSRQIIQNNIYYTGSAMQHAFGESEKNIIAYLSFQNKDYNREEIDLQLPRKKIIYMDVEDIDNYNLPNTEDKLKVTLNGNYDQFKALKKTKKYKNLIEKGVKVVFKPKKIKQKNKENNEDGKEIEMNEIDNNENISNDFKSILNSIIMKERNPYLFKTHELIVNGSNIENNDIMFL